MSFLSNVVRVVRVAIPVVPVIKAIVGVVRRKPKGIDGIMEVLESVPAPVPARRAVVPQMENRAMGPMLKEFLQSLLKSAIATAIAAGIAALDAIQAQPFLGQDPQAALIWAVVVGNLARAGISVLVAVRDRPAQVPPPTTPPVQ